MPPQRRAADRYEGDTREIAVTTAELLKQHVGTCAEDAKAARDEARRLHDDRLARNRAVDERFTSIETTMAGGFKELRGVLIRVAGAVLVALLSVISAMLIHKMGLR